MRIITGLRKFILTLLALLTLVVTLNISVASARSSGPDFSSVISSLFTNPSSLITFIVEFALGLGLGYFSAKAIKYLLAIIGIFIVGVVLNVWNAPNLWTNIQQQLGNLGLEWSKVYPALLSMIYMLGLTTILPITLGFILGVIIAAFNVPLWRR